MENGHIYIYERSSNFAKSISTEISNAANKVADAVSSTYHRVTRTEDKSNSVSKTNAIGPYVSTISKPLIETGKKAFEKLKSEAEAEAQKRKEAEAQKRKEAEAQKRKEAEEHKQNFIETQKAKRKEAEEHKQKSIEESQRKLLEASQQRESESKKKREYESNQKSTSFSDLKSAVNYFWNNPELLFKAFNRSKEYTEKPTELSDIPLIDHEETIYESIVNSNPNYYDKSTRYTADQNCSYCSLAYEFRRRGLDVVANIEGADTERPTEKTIEMWWGLHVLKDPTNSDLSKTVTHEDRSGLTSNEIKNVENDMLSCGNGARFHLAVQWLYGSGHSFMAEVQDGQVYVVDAQVGKVCSLDEYLGRAYEVSYFRTDTLDLSYKYTHMPFNGLLINPNASKFKPRSHTGHGGSF